MKKAKEFWFLFARLQQKIFDLSEQVDFLEDKVALLEHDLQAQIKELQDLVIKPLIKEPGE